MVALVPTLQTLPASRVLYSKNGSRNLFHDFLRLNSAVSSDKSDIERIRPLLDAVSTMRPMRSSGIRSMRPSPSPRLLPVLSHPSTNAMAAQHKQPHTWAIHYPTRNEIRETGTGLFDVSVKVKQSYNANVYSRDKKCMKIGMVEEKC